jgi:acyl-CoA synthetase (AMP-forming)/AMP-acid ligase II
LIALGATPVFIEAKRDGLIKRIIATSSDFVLLSEKAKKLKFLFPYFWTKRAFIFNHNSFGICSLNENDHCEDDELTLSKMQDSEPLLISFTTGSTGQPKAADRNYFVSYSQHCASLKYWHHTDEDVDLTFFPNILFQNLCSGVTTLIPKMLVKDLRDISFHRFEKIIEDYKVTRISAPPGYLNELCNSLNHPNLQIRKVITGGAPVDKKLAKKVLSSFPNAESNVVYGSTEAEPIAFKSLEGVANSTEKGFLVGKPIDEISVIINAPDESSIRPCENGEVGEVLISGNHVVQRYLNSDLDNKEFKVKDDKGLIWHKTGDIGYFNNNLELVLLGRKNYALKTKEGLKFSLSLENDFNESLPGDKRCAILKKDNKVLLKIEKIMETDIKTKAEDFM